MMKIYVVSLARAIERRHFMKAQLDKLGMNYEIVDAVDYQDLSDEDFAKLTDRDAVSRIPYLTPGAQACALSHVKVLNKIISDNQPHALVLEDDAVLTPELPSVLAEVSQQLRADEVISLSYYYRYDIDTFLSNHDAKRLSDKNQLVYPVSLHKMGSTMAYVISKEVAAKLIKIMMPISVTADWWGVYYDKGGFTSFRCVYPFQLKPAIFSSTLDYEDVGIKSRIAAMIRRYKVPILYNILTQRDQRYLEEKYKIHLVDQLPFHQNPETFSYTDLYYARP